MKLSSSVRPLTCLAQHWLLWLVAAPQSFSWDYSQDLFSWQWAEFILQTFYRQSMCHTIGFGDPPFSTSCLVHLTQHHLLWLTATLRRQRETFSQSQLLRYFSWPCRGFCMQIVLYSWAMGPPLNGGSCRLRPPITHPEQTIYWLESVRPLTSVIQHMVCSDWQQWSWGLSSSSSTCLTYFYNWASRPSVMHLRAYSPAGGTCGQLDMKAWRVTYYHHSGQGEVINQAILGWKDTQEGPNVRTGVDEQLQRWG